MTWYKDGKLFPYSLLRNPWFWRSLICRVVGHDNSSPPEFDDTDVFRCSRCGGYYPTNGMSWKTYYRTHERVRVCFGDDAWGREDYVWLPKDRDKTLDRTFCV